MSDVIRLLPDSVANQIAAGEVIQRPASVIKELVENAVDAGATDIRIILKDAGRTLIQVIDNGCGMSTTDARLAFERHATSKIEQASDLFALRTMGFRGEALASIAAIAQVELRTMRKEDTVGTRVVINGSKVESQQPEACVPGTNLMVKNLFYNVPARRKFLKKDSVELSNIMHEFERLALVNTGVEFTLIHNDVTLHQLMRGSLKQRIVALFGKSLDRQLIPVETDTSIVRLDGFVGLPENARKRGALQYFFVNGRNMRHPYFHKAVMQCYEQLIPADEQPCYFLNFNVDPETIDVNIHPTKNEIKFENEQPIWQIIVAAVRESLGKFNAGPAIDFDAVDVPDIPVFDPDAGANHDVELDASYNPFAQPSAVERPSAMQSMGGSGASFTRPMEDWEALYDNFRRESDASMAEVCGSRLNSADTADEIPGMTFDSPMTAADDSDRSTSVMQLKGRYILSPAKEGLRIIDQHRAHVKILYERFMAMIAAGTMTMQRLIFPEVIRLAPSMQPIMEEISSDLCSIGFDVAYLGDTSWSINGVPAVIDSLNPVEIVTGLVETVAETGQTPGNELYGKVALTMHAARRSNTGRPCRRPRWTVC